MTIDRSGLPGFSRWEPLIRSFVTRDHQAQGGDGPLQGLSIGVKDIIDVKGLPTRNGSAACADAPPAASDAPVVAALRRAGARIVGKTVTTEFAFTDPTDCRNPHDLDRSPGGSSSGSGAAVAAGLVDLALGTQTAGSLCRPAAYCGVPGFKPGHGVLPTDGVTPLAPSFDSVGIIARSVGMARLAFAAVTEGTAVPSEDGAPQVVCGLFDGLARATEDARAALHGAREGLDQRGVAVRNGVLDVDVAAIVAAHRTVMLAEAAQAHGALLRAGRGDDLRPRFRDALIAGAALSASDVQKARIALANAREAFWQGMDGVDAILTLPVPEGAPRLDGTTGFQDWLTPWTVFGGPLISLPWGLDRLGRPTAVMLAGPPGTEMRLLALAERLEVIAPPIAPPVPPQS